MHSWCFLTRAIYIDDGSLQRALPFHCLTCEEIGIFNIHDGTMIFSLKIDAEGDDTLTREEEEGNDTRIGKEEEGNDTSSDEEDTYSDVEDDETDGRSDD
ncbi:UNVERIFIED_CONTAM: hypothetical protein Slati_1161500 [Sesamum latifolium]|uniref:Uncharacterized protein n=1 Tax=Sesamum latifolium TaxID=2727402 RepID=A0AAW2XCN7_9LAMI